MISLVKKLTLGLLIVLLALQTPGFCKKPKRKVPRPHVHTFAAPSVQKMQSNLVIQTQPQLKKDYKKNYLDLAFGTYVGLGSIFTWNLYDLVGLRVGQSLIDIGSTWYHAGFNLYLFKDSNHSPYMGLGITAIRFNTPTSAYLGFLAGYTSLDLTYWHLGYSTEVNLDESIKDSLVLHLSAEVSRMLSPDIITKSNANLWGGQISVGAVF
jgi:hypothetical protein